MATHFWLHERLRVKLRMFKESDDLVFRTFPSLVKKKGSQGPSLRVKLRTFKDRMIWCSGLSQVLSSKKVHKDYRSTIAG